MALLILGLILFFATHLLRVLVPGLRDAMTGALGLRGWHIAHSLVSTVTLLMVVYGFDLARQTTGILYEPPVWMAHIAITLMLIATICLIASALPAGRIARKTRFPLVLSVKIWALAHLIANGETASVLLFTSFLAWGVILRISLKRRERAGLVAIRPFVSARYDILAVILGTLVWIAFIWKLHEWLIGVSPLAM